MAYPLLPMVIRSITRHAMTILQNSFLLNFLYTTFPNFAIQYKQPSLVVH